MSNISIKGLDKAAVLAALYNASQQQGMGFMPPRGAKPMTTEEAQQEINSGGWLPQSNSSQRIYFDYLHGRVMKVDIGGDELNPFLYDRDNGNGAAEEALKHLLDKQPA